MLCFLLLCHSRATKQAIGTALLPPPMSSWYPTCPKATIWEYISVVVLLDVTNLPLLLSVFISNISHQLKRKQEMLSVYSLVVKLAKAYGGYTCNNNFLGQLIRYNASISPFSYNKNPIKIRTINKNSGKRQLILGFLSFVSFGKYTAFRGI